ncbi:DNA cytosine methyltransferase [Kribbella sp. NPDC020789]
MVDLFAGPGGLDVAAQWLGVAAAGIEWDANACETRREAGLRTERGDVRNFGPDKFAGAKILTGGPPCQTYTVAGNGNGRRALAEVVGAAKAMADGEDVVELFTDRDVRTRLVLEPLRWVLEAHAEGEAYDSIVLEQVPAVLPVWKTVRKVLKRIGYSCECDILRTEQFGVPQTRRRAILIARKGAEVVLPEPTHHAYRRGVARGVGDESLDRWNTMGETLDRATPFTVISNYGTGGDPKMRGTRTSDEPAFTVTGKVFRNRVRAADGTFDRFDAEEAGRLQTFPHDYPWSGHDVAQQIGNAIPPRLAVHVLAAALGRKVDTDSLNKAVTRSWTDANVTSPLVRSTPVVDK